MSAHHTEVADWEHLLTLAKEERLLLPLWLSIDREAVPQALRDATEAQTTMLVMEEMRRGRQLAEIMTLLGPDARAYKGPTLGAVAFGSASHRESGDLDILVPALHYKKSVEILLSDGFQHFYGEVPRCYLELHYEVTLFHPGRRVTVDLHRSFFSEAMPLHLAGRTEVTLGGKAIPTLPPDELLVLLAVHGCKHAWRELRWVYDLVALMRRHDLDWSRVKQLAQSKGAFRACCVALGLCNTLFQSEVPNEFKGDRIAQSLVEESLTYIGQASPKLPQLNRYQWRTFDHARQRARFLAVTVFRPHELDLRWVDLPKEMWYLYYLIRPFRVLWSRLGLRKEPENG